MRRRGRTVEGEELIPNEPVILGGCLPDVMA